MFQGEYVLVGMERSLFTRKLEAQLRYQQIPYRFEINTLERQEVWKQRSGQHRIPVLETPEGWVMWDTTPIGVFLDQRFPQAAVIPTTPVQKAACLMLEDFIDEWLGRVAVHSRWCYDDNAAQVGFFMAKAMLLDKTEAEPLTAEEEAQVQQASTMVRDSFGLPACKGLGVGPEHAAFARAEFDRWMRAFDGHFPRHPFLLGDRPCMADFTVCAGLKAHFAVDPQPRQWLDEVAPELVRWMEQCWDATADAVGDWLPDDQLPETLAPLLAMLSDSFRPWSLANRAAIEAGEKIFEADVGAGPQSFRRISYSEVSRRNVCDELGAMTPSAQARVREAFAGTGALDVYSP